MNTDNHTPWDPTPDFTAAELQAIYEATADVQPMPSVDLDAAWESFRTNASVDRRPQRIWLKIAASLLILITVGLASTTWASRDGYQYVEAKQTQSLTLPDKSEVSLKKSSKISYPKRFGKERLVSLEGEAFFDIEKAADPFIVSAGDVKVTVLGTEFLVRESDAGDVDVAVREGKVRVESPDGSVVILTAGDKVSYSKDSATLGDKTPSAQEWSWASGQLVFMDEPLSKVIDAISEHYDVEITLGKSRMLDCPFTSSLPIKDAKIEDLLQSIALVMDMKVKSQSSSSFHLSGGYCK